MSTEQLVTLIAHSTTLPATLASAGWLVLHMVKLVLDRLPIIAGSRSTRELAATIGEAAALMMSKGTSQKQREGAQLVLVTLAPQVFKILSQLDPPPGAPDEPPGGR